MRLELTLPIRFQKTLFLAMYNYLY